MASDTEQATTPKAPFMSTRRRANSVQAYEKSEQSASRFTSKPPFSRSNTSNTTVLSNIIIPTAPGLSVSRSEPTPTPTPAPPRPSRNPARPAAYAADSLQAQHHLPPSRLIIRPPAPREEITPWEFIDPPSSPSPPPEDLHPPTSTFVPQTPSKSRLPTSGSSFSSFVRRRKSTGNKPSHHRSTPRPPSPSSSNLRSAPPVDAFVQPQQQQPPQPNVVPVHHHHHAHQASPAFAAHSMSHLPPQPHPLQPQQPPPSVPTQSTTNRPNFNYNTADRTILEELKRAIEARSSQYTLKGPGLKKERHHRFTKDQVPYPRNYSSIAVDLDVWETIFCQSLCNSPTWHVFDQPPTKVLDIGCGTGTWVLEAARVWRGCHFVGLDIVPLQPDLLQVGSSDLANRITWVHTNFLEGLPFHEDEFDYVHIKRIALGVPEDKWDPLFEEISRVLKPGGALELLEEDLFFPGTVSDDSASDVEEDDDGWSMTSATPQSPSHTTDHAATTTNSDIPSNSTSDLSGVAEDDEGGVSESDRFEIITSAIPQDYQPPDLTLTFGTTPRRQDTAPAASTSSHSPPAPSSPELQVFKLASPIRHDHPHPHNYPPTKKFRMPRRPATSPGSRASTDSHMSSTVVDKFNNTALTLLSSSGGASIAFGGMAALSSEPLPLLLRKPIPGKPSVSSSITYVNSNDSTMSPLSPSLGPVPRIENNTPPPVNMYGPMSEDLAPRSAAAASSRPSLHPINTTTTTTIPFLQRTPATSFKSPINPRNHTLLKFIYDEMNAARFVNLCPVSLITHTLNTHFKQVRINPPLTCTFPPETLEPPKSQKFEDVDEEAQDAIIPDLKFRRESATTTPHHSSIRHRGISEDGRWLTLRGAAMGISPYVQFDQSKFSVLNGNKLPAREFTSAPLNPKQLLPNMDFCWDLLTLNLHLAVRVIEILSCVEAMWEHVLSVQEEYKDKPIHMSPPANLVFSVPSSHGRNKAKRRERIAALVDMTREDFDILIRNFEMDMRENMHLDSVIRGRLGWPNSDRDPPAEREAFIAANEVWREYEAQRSRKLKGSSSQSHDGGGGNGVGTRSRSSSTRTRTSGGGGERSSGSSAGGASVIPPSKDNLRPSRALKVFIAWNAS